ncbi:MAG: SGNH/GDSL hydrolase family protein [Patescibacteria group bacterium]
MKNKILKNKKILVALIVVLGLAIYLYLAHFSIYYKLGHTDLRPTDRHIDYTITSSQENSVDFIYVALGDSLASGVGVDKYEDSYPYLLAEKIAAASDKTISLKNFSFPGAKTSQVISNQLSQAISAEPDMITILIGTNDVHGNISLDKFKKNYDYILEKLTTTTKAEIYILGLPNIGTDKLLWPPYNYYFRQKTSDYNTIIKELADKYNLVYIDLEKVTLEEFNKDNKYYASDLFHPSALGYDIWAQIIYGNIYK